MTSLIENVDEFIYMFLSVSYFYSSFMECGWSLKMSGGRVVMEMMVVDCGSEGQLIVYDGKSFSKPTC